MAQPGGAGELYLDVEKAKAAVDQLKTVRDRLDSLVTEAQFAAQIQPTARDMVSLKAFSVLGDKAIGEEGSLVNALVAARENVQGMMDQMTEDIASQERIEDDATRSLRRP